MLEEEEYTFLELNYISCEGNDRYKIVKVNEHYTEGEVIECLMSDSGYDDAPATYLSMEEVFFDDDAVDWTHLGKI